jgi:DNA repair protein RecO (recombination protein O)
VSNKESEALVIRSYNLSEADRIVVFFTREFGIVRGVAKGARRLMSRFGSTLEPFSTVSLHWFQKEDRELVSIQQAELVRSRFETASDPEFLETFSYIGDLLMDFTPPHDADETLYRMINACMSAAEAQSDLSAVRLYFELWLLRLGGFLPDWNACENCRREISIDEIALLVPGFHLHCRQCRKGSAMAEVSSAEREVFRNVQKLPPAEFATFAENRKNDVAAISSVMKRIIAQVLGREVATGAAVR